MPFFAKYDNTKKPWRQIVVASLCTIGCCKKDEDINASAHQTLRADNLASSHQTGLTTAILYIHALFFLYLFLKVHGRFSQSSFIRACRQFRQSPISRIAVRHWYSIKKQLLILKP